VERSAVLAPKGVIALLVPSSLSDLAGYQAARVCLRETHEPAEPLEEFGEDAFPGVVQPCFGLIAVPRSADGSFRPRELVHSAEETLSPGRPFLLSERAVQRAEAALEAPPPELLALSGLPTFPAHHFRELGFQSDRRVTAELLRRGSPPEGAVLLLEGKDVREFHQGAPSAHLLLPGAGSPKVRLRAVSEYQQVEFVLRQTARFPIAALHGGGAFRNSLLAGYGDDRFSAEVLVALLNSTLLRAFHLARHRDARQRTFPQVKLQHLRALPAPPAEGFLLTRRDELADLTRRATLAGGPEPRDRLRLDALVADSYGLEEEARVRVTFWFERRLSSLRDS